MNDLPWRLAIACLAGSVCMLRTIYDVANMPSKRRRECLIHLTVQLFAVTVGVQLLGFDPLPMGLRPAMDIAVRTLGVALGLFAGTMVLWPRLVRRSWSGPLTLPDRRNGHELVTWGPYRHIRHPFYLSLVAGLASLELALASYLLFLIVPLFAALVTIVVKIEEEQLTIVYGSEYARYREKSWRLLPLIY